MLNLIKYELIKQRGSKFIALGIFAILEVIFLLGVLLEKDGFLGFGMGFLAIVSIVFIFWLGIEAIFTLSNDMKNKSGYMLFMTPQSVYKIMAGKVLSSIITIIIAMACIALLALADMTILLVRFSSIKEFTNMVRDMTEAFTGIDFSWQSGLGFLIMLILSWISMVAAGFVAVTISNTLLANLKAKGLISFVIFIAVGIISSYILNILYGFIGYDNNILVFVINLAVSVITTLICFIVSGECMKRRLAL